MDPAAIEILDEPTAVYRLYDSSGALLYVGISCNPTSRLAQHKSEKPWWYQVARKTITMHGSRREAEIAEGKAIRSEQPVHNIAMGRREREPGHKLPAILRKPAADKRKPPVPMTQPKPTLIVDLTMYAAELEAYAKFEQTDPVTAVGKFITDGLLKYYGLPDRNWYENGGSKAAQSADAT